MTKHSPAVSPFFGLALGILAASTASIFIRYAQSYQVPSLVIAALRLSLATLIPAPLALTRYRPELRRLERAEWILALLSGVFLALHFATWITSLEHTTIASSVVLVSTAPVWVALLTPFTIKERIPPLALAGMLLAFAGGIVVALSDTCAWSGWRLACPTIADFVRGKAFFGDLLALAGAWMAGAYLLAGRRVRRKTSLIPYIFIVYGAAAVLLLVIAVLARQPAWGYPWGSAPAYPLQAYGWIALLALVPQLLGHSSFNWALRYLSAAFVSISLLGEPVGSTILALVLFREIPSALKVIGVVLILAGIVLAGRYSEG